MCLLCMSFGLACSASATGTPKTADTKTKNTNTAETKNKAAAVSKNMALVEKRANNLSDQMIRELRLNNYQANKIRQINMDVTAQIAEVEEQFKGNQQLIEEKCKAVLAARDVAFEDVLSTVQYNDYFGDRKVYDKFDKQYLASLSQQGSDKIASADNTIDGATAGNAASGNASTVN